MQTIGAFFEALKPLLPPGVEFSTDAKELDAHGAPPSISTYPATETFSAPKQPNRVGEGRSIMTRTVTLPTYLWGESIEDTEELLRAFLVALRQVATGVSFAVSGGEWLNSKGLIKDGHVLVITVTLDLALQENPLRTVRPDNMTIAREFVDVSQGS